LVAPELKVAPRDPRAAEGIDHFGSYLGPTTGYVEQVYWHDLLSDATTHQTVVALRNSSGDRAVALRYDKRQLPCFTQWKNTAALADGYVTGLEPGTNFPNTRRFERERGRVLRIDPGQSYRCAVVVEVYADRDRVKALEQEIAALQGSAAPTVHAQPQAKYSKL
jgi:hypothetical protein